MFHKRDKEYKEGIPPSKRLRSNLGDLFLSNKISGQRAQEIFSDAALAGASHVADLAKGSDNPSVERLERNPNAARDLARRLLKNCPWPTPYWAQIPVWDVQDQKASICKLPLLLPHEMLYAVKEHASGLEQFLDRSALCTQSLRHLQEMEVKYEAPGSLAVGLWVDGTPYSFDRMLSLESVVISMPGLAEPNKGLRLPVAVVPKQFCLKKTTMAAIFFIVSWSMRHLALGRFPSCRHDRQPWTQEDSKRKKSAGSLLGFQGFLCELRGDWAMRKELLSFPGWKDATGCCHLCAACPEDIKDFSSQAPWRSARLGHFDLMNRILEGGNDINPLFSSPGFTSQQVLLDWLRTMDLGVTADFLGNLFYHLVKGPVYIEGSTQEQKVRNLFVTMQAYYKEGQPSSRLQNLTLLMIRKSTSSSPKLRAKAAEARSLVSFARAIAEELLGDTQLEKTIKQAARLLEVCYQNLRYYQHDEMLQCATKFLLLIAPLEDLEQKLWKIKPKHHAMLEMCLQDSNPADTWTYRDEDVGGYLAGLARLQGGHHNAKSVGISVLNRWRAKCVPDLKTLRSHE